MVFLRAMGAAVGEAAPASSSRAEPRTIQLPVQRLTADSFRPFGQVISANNDGKQFDHEDAQLQLDQGTPRFYIMRIPRRGMKFDRITYHEKVTQCLGGLAAKPWYMAVAAPSGSREKYPQKGDLHAFEIPQGSFIKMHAGTWHAGPLFDNADEMDFYNLELADTNVVDHNTHVYKKEDNLNFELVGADAS